MPDVPTQQASWTQARPTSNPANGASYPGAPSAFPPAPGGYPTPQAGYPHSAYQTQAPQPLPTGAPAARPAKKRGRGRRISLLITALIVAWITFMVGTPLYAWTQTTTVNATPAGNRPPDQPGTMILLVGSDARDTLSAEQRGELGTGDTDGKRTDTMMLLYSPPTGRPALISLPRDSYLAIPGHGKDKLNAAYAFGGAPLLVQTIEQNTGVRIDGYLEVGFLGIVEVVNALGGIEVCLQDAIKDKDSHLDLPAGCQTLDGKNALGYVRMRKADPTGDLGRMNRQRQMIGLITKKASSPQYLFNPVSYWGLNMAAAKTVSLGKGTGPLELASTALAFRAVSSGNGLTLTVPIAKANATSPSGASIMVWDETGAKEMFSTIISGTTDGLDKFVR